MSLFLLPLCFHYLGRHWNGPTLSSTRKGVGLLAMAAWVWVLPWCTWLFAGLGALSVAGLVATYLCLNLAISGAVLNLKETRATCAKAGYLAGLMTLLFLGEGALLSWVKSQ